MKLLCLGCLHGKIPKKLVSKLKQEEFDYVLCTGDLVNADKTRKLFFKNWELLNLGFSLEDIVNKKKLGKIKKEEIKSMDNSIKLLNSLGKKVMLVYGNNDHYEALRKKIKKGNIKLIKNSSLTVDGLRFVGHSGYCLKESKKLRELLRMKKVVFMSHVPPFGYFDKVKLKLSPRYSEHVGDELCLKMIKKYNPMIHVSSHMHEHQGKKKIGKTWIINSGAAYLGKYAIVEIKNNKVIGTRIVK